VLKPRAEATAIGIVKIEEKGTLWQHLEHLGDRRSHFLLERFVPGNVYHVDSIVCGSQVVFAEAHGYGRPPMEIFHGGGISLSRTVPRGSEDEQLLYEVNRHVLATLGMHQGASHMEFIKGSGDGRFYFLEVGARVGGANTAEMVEAATGINLWAEWARVVVLGDRYSLPPRRANYGGVVVSLARQEHPDTSSFTDPEIVYRLDKHHHIGFVLASESHERIRQLQDEYSRRIAHDYLATMPAWETRPPTE
jgi:biotin carboxylase